jgi:hypothetical protein
MADKLCKCGCGRSGPIWSQGLLQSCWKRIHGKPIKRTAIISKGITGVKPVRKPVKKVSEKRAEQLRIYYKLVPEFLRGKKCGACEILKRELGDKAPKCNGIATEVHHKGGRTGSLLLFRGLWLPIGRGCHSFITDHSALAIHLDLSVSRILATRIRYNATRIDIDAKNQGP